MHSFFEEQPDIMAVPQVLYVDRSYHAPQKYQYEILANLLLE